MALCTTGSCRKFWYDYIEVCSREGGLFPATVTMDWIRLQMQQLDSHTGSQQKDFGDVTPDEILEELAKQAAGIPSSLTAGPVSFTIEPDEGLSITEPSSYASRSLKDNSADDVTADRDYLLTLVREQSERYIRCKLYIASQNDIYADFMDEPVRQDMALKGIDHVEIKGRSNCERAFSLDEVVVELLECDCGRAVGKVLGVVRKCSSRENLTAVCMADRNTCTQGIVRPLDPSLPCFRTLVPKKDNRDSAKKWSYISLYTYCGDQPVFRHFVKINPDRPYNVFFKVRFLKWTRKSHYYHSPYPLGVVTEIIPLGSDFDSAVKILAINCQIRENFPAKALAEVDEAVRHHSAGSFSLNFTDSTDLRVFTIDGEKAEDLDDAVSLVMGDDTCRVYVHIVDVTYFVQKDSCIDTEAFERLQTFYRDEVDDPLVAMLPHKLSTDLCSLLPDRLRPAVSFWYEIQLGTCKIVKSDVFRSLVKSCKKFTYKEVNDVLSNKPASEFDDELRQLFDVTRAWSIQRGTKCVTDAKQMVAELMVKVNETAASLVMEKFPHCVPLWMNQAKSEINETSDVVPDRFSQEDSDESFLLLKPVWWKIMKAAVDRSFTDVTALLLDADRHGQELWHHLDWSEDASQKTYRCSGAVDDDTSEKWYMRVTSPMRRYMDLVSLRMLVAAIEGHEVSPYNTEEMENLCQHANDGLRQKNKFQHEIVVLKRAVELKNRAAVVFPYISSFSESSLTLRFPSNTVRRQDLQDMRYSGLDLAKNPVVETSVTFDWQQRIYDLQHPNAVQTEGTTERKVALPNGNDRYCYRLPTDVWKSLVEKAKFCHAEELDGMVKTINNEHILNQMIQKDSCKDTAVTAEVFNRADEDFREHFVRMSLGMSTGSLTQVQLTADVIDGMLKPTVQLFCLTPKLDICVEHRQHALKCFSTEFAKPASRPRYQSLEEYQQAWLSVISMEAANSAVEEGGANICGVRIKWWKVDGQIHGKIQLGSEFCKRRQISFYPMNARYFQEDYKLLPEENKPRMFRGLNEFDYLCIRYTGSLREEEQDMFSGKFSISEPPNRTGQKRTGEKNRRKAYAEVVKTPPAKALSSDDYEKSPSWVGHGITKYITRFSRKKKTKMINVHFKLHQYSSDFPTILLKKGLHIDCTVEWIPKLTPQQ